MKILKRVIFIFLSLLVSPMIYYNIRRFKIGDMIRKDVDRYVKEGIITTDNNKALLSLFLRRDLCFRDVFYYRCHQQCHILRFLFRPYPNLVIDSSVEADGGAFFFHHPFSTYINASYIGYGCTFRNNTTIGNKNVNGRLIAPRLSGYNDIGVNSCIIGGIEIGVHSVVGAGSVVVKDVPSFAVVAGNPAVVIKLLNDREDREQ